MPPALSPQYDPEGFAAAKKLWEAHLAKPDVSPFLVYRAARFFAPHDKPYAEQLILRGMAMDPESAALKARMPPTSAATSGQRNSPTSTPPRSRVGKYVGHLQRPPHASRQAELAVREGGSEEARGHDDARLLAHVGALLARPRGREQDAQLQEARDRARTLGLGYLRRALQLDQNLESAKIALYYATASESENEGARLAREAELASARGDGAREVAQKILERSKAHANDPAYSRAIMSAHQTLALTAARNGDRDRALQHLNDSLKVPISDEIRYAPPMAWMRPVNELLKAGERQRVVEFLEAYAQMTVRDRQRLLDDAKAVREGRMPSSYQHMAYRETTPSPFKPQR